MNNENENKISIDLIKKFLIGVIDDDNDEKTSKIKRIYKLCRKRDKDVFDLRRRIAKYIVDTEDNEEQSGEIQICIDIIKRAICKGIREHYVKERKLNVIHFERLYKKLTGKDCKDRIVYGDMEKNSITILNNLKAKLRNCTGIKLTEFHNLYEELTGGDLKEKLVKENSDIIKKRIIDEILKKVIGESASINIEKFHKLYEEFTGGDFKEILIHDNSSVIKETIKQAIKKEATRITKSGEIYLLEKFFELYKQYIGKDFIEQLNKDYPKFIKEQCFQHILINSLYLKKIDPGKLSIYLGRDIKKEILKDRDASDALKVEVGDSCYGYGTYEGNEKCYKKYLMEAVKKQMENQNKEIYQEINIAPCLEKYLEELASKILEERAETYYTDIPNGSYMIPYLNEIADTVLARRLEEYYVNIPDGSYLTPYFKECISKIMEKADVQYYKEIEDGPYLDEYLEECADKVLEKGYGDDCNEVRGEINKFVDKKMLDKIELNLEYYYSNIIKNLRECFLKCKKEEQGYVLE